MQNDDGAHPGLWKSLRIALGFGPGRPKEIRYERFRDGMGNFEIFYPRGWKFDRDIAVVDGKYTISFQSPGGHEQLTVAVDSQLEPGFRFSRYAKQELESPSSGILAQVRKASFHGMPAYERDYSYRSSGRWYFGGGVMFYSGSAVYSLSWSAPENRKEALSAIFRHMLDSLSVRKGFTIRRMGARPGRGKAELVRMDSGEPPGEG